MSAARTKYYFKYAAVRAEMLWKSRKKANVTIAAQGFTLLEVLVSVLILSVAYVAVLQNFSQSMANIFRLDKGRALGLQEFLAFERQLAEAEQEGAASLDGETLVRGQKFYLKKIFSRNGRLETVRLEKI